MAGFGAALGPVALAWGLQHTSGTSASLMLSLEALFTATLAWWLYSETMDRRIGTAMLLLLAGGMSLVLDQGLQGAVQLLGLLAVTVATIAWGVDNALSRSLAERDPSQVVMAKAALGSLATATLAVSFGEPLPSLASMLGLLAIGATGYGLSLRFYLLAQRAFGAARTGSVFAFAPFMGALAGDAFLMVEGFFIPGLVSFLLAHLAYIALFKQGVPWFAHRGALAATVGVGAAMYLFLWQGGLPPELRVPVAVYVLVIALMAAQALGRARTLGDRAAHQVALGACIFMLSDALLATNRFVLPLPLAQVGVLTTYYAAQAFIVHGMVRGLLAGRQSV